MNDIHRADDLRETSLDAPPAAHGSMLRKVLLVVAVLAVLALAAWLLTPAKGDKAAGGRFAGGGPMPIVASAARTGSMPITLIGLGAVTPIATVTVQSQVSGQIVKVLFKEGQNVKPGDPLFQIDPRPFQVALEQAQGQLARDKALLANARTDQQRYETLLSQDSIAEQTLATQKSLVVQDEGTVKTDQGAVDAARLNLDYAHIVAPIIGRAGLQQVNLGNYVTPAEPNGLVVIAQMKPITASFSLPEDQIPPLLAQLRQGKVLSVAAWDRTHTTALATGVLQSIDSTIDPTTGTLKMKALFANEDEMLFPQQFVNIELLLNTLQGVVLVPQAAIQRGAPGTYVYVVNQDQTVSLRKVTIGPGNSTDIVVSAGLKAGESVVTDGADKLKDGAKVLVRQPGAAPAAAGAAAAPPAQGKGQGQHKHRQGGQGATGDHGGSAPAQ